MHPMLNIAVKAARRAGNLIHRAADNIDHLTVTKKAPRPRVAVNRSFLVGS